MDLRGEVDVVKKDKVGDVAPVSQEHVVAIEVELIVAVDEQEAHDESRVIVAECVRELCNYIGEKHKDIRSNDVRCFVDFALKGCRCHPSLQLTSILLKSFHDFVRHDSRCELVLSHAIRNDAFYGTLDDLRVAYFNLVICKLKVVDVLVEAFDLLLLLINKSSFNSVFRLVL